MTLYDAIISAGFDAPEAIVWDGKLHRFPTDLTHHRHSDDGWYVAHDDATGKAAAFGSWRDGVQHTWGNGTGRVLSVAELDVIKRQQVAAKADEKKRRDQAALRAQRIYDQASSEVEHSAYLVRKGISLPEGVRAVMGLSSKAFGFEGAEWAISGLIVPMRNRDGEMRSLQIIPDAENSKKLFMKSGQTAAVFHVLGAIEGSTRILIAEGLATAQSVRTATGDTAVVAFSAGNLKAVAGAVRAITATAEMVICADDDPAGRTGAEACHGCRVVFPDQGCNDFNDLHQAHGLAAVKRAILGDDPAPQETVEWRADLIVKHKDDGTQSIPCRVHNLILLLKHAPEFYGRIKLNLFSEQVSIDGQDAKKVAVTRIKAEIERHWIHGEKVPAADVSEALAVVADHNKFHPVCDYLNGLEWDGEPRIDEFFSEFCGTPRDAYHIAVARALFISAVLRILRPGCKVDTMVILEGPQGIGKTKLWIALFSPWYAEVVDSLNGRDFFIGLRGVWCADFGELDQFNKAESTRIKQVITSQSDNYRGMWAEGHEKHARQCIFVGGTNSDAWQKDATGARRFLPVRMSRQINADDVAAIRDKLFAEAMYLVSTEQTGRWWDIPDAAEHQDESYAGDPWEQPITEYLNWIEKTWESDGLRGATRAVAPETTTHEVLLDGLKIEKGRQTRADEMRVSAVLKRNGWVRKQRSKGGWCYRKYT
jgi:putative DNA primase/helicase